MNRFRDEYELNISQFFTEGEYIHRLRKWTVAESRLIRQYRRDSAVTFMTILKSIAGSDIIRSRQDLRDVERLSPALFDYLHRQSMLFNSGLSRDEVDFLKHTIEARWKGFEGTRYEGDERRMFNYFAEYVDVFFSLRDENGIIRATYGDVQNMNTYEYTIYCAVQSFSIEQHNKEVRRHGRR